MWLLIDSDTHEVVSGPQAQEPSAEGAYATIVALGYPQTVVWSPAARGFVDRLSAASLSRIAYQRLFTQAERIAIRASVDPVVVDFRELAALAETIDLDDADVVAGTQYLESLGLIAVGRSAAILLGQAPS